MFRELGDDQVEQVLDLQEPQPGFPFADGLRQLPHIGARAEPARPLTAEHHLPHRVVVGPRGEDLACCLEHLEIEGVDGVGTVEGESSDPVVQGGDEQISHEDSL